MMIVALEVAIPAIFATIDLVVCLFNFFTPGTWDAQLRCVERTCFQGPDAAADVFVFLSVPIVLERFSAILEATLNSRTAQSFTQNSGKIDLGISDLGNIFPGLSANGCASCFQCKWPEIRAIWFALTTLIQLFDPINFEHFQGNVTQLCMTNGSFYVETLCGPRGGGAETMSFASWKSAFPSSYYPFDADITGGYAGLLEQRAQQMGGAASGDGAMAEATARAWFERDQTLPEREQAAHFHYLMCRQWREAFAGERDESPEKYVDHAEGSIRRITSLWATDTCRRFKFEVYGAAQFERIVTPGFAHRVLSPRDRRREPRAAQSGAGD
jgi:hypothetical protein